MHDDQVEFRNGDLRGVPAGIRPGTTQDVAGQVVPVDAETQKVISS